MQGRLPLILGRRLTYEEVIVLQEVNMSNPT